MKSDDLGQSGQPARDVSASSTGTAPEPTAEAARVFGTRLNLARRYADFLAGDGVRHGHLGPREVPRLWDRHLVNCGLLADLLPENVRLVDVGSGAGLPGIAIAIRRPDLVVDLVEPMLRRVGFLRNVVESLGISANVRVVRGRAEDGAVVDAVGNVDFVVARAVAPLDRLVRWSLPLLAPGGSLLAMKGASAQAEIGQHGSALRRAGAARFEVVQLGTGMVAGTWVVRVERAASAGRASGRRRRAE